MISVQLFCFKGGGLFVLFHFIKLIWGWGILFGCLLLLFLGGETQELLDFCDDLFV